MKYTVLLAVLYTHRRFLLFSLSLSLFLSLIFYRLCWIFLDDEEKEEKFEKLRMIRLHTSSCDGGYCETQFALNTYKTASLREEMTEERI